MATGTVKFFNADRGFGFIKPDDGEADVFVHIRQVANSTHALRENQRVSFEIGTDAKRGKPQAEGVRVL